ncbi:Hsp20/alpha crystallin family protein [Robertkochia marina]|uniref:Hsp20/alpha crystallin family protein n=1 Tax=Robertkochia marina TaxID=1227945 RepID=A0A4S3LZP5_9FLAO|nr:Hsp20/alpha crystallin family protein [Robertkochia marina]THD67551.1 Hsp20/alpha crystallin family protein [Robertkochia marina]TRZ44581.1 Hsp20/alpha crystallin family protein [Robertkochia marina]
MSLVRFKRRRPWFAEELTDLFSTEGLLPEEWQNRAVLRQPAMNIREGDEYYELELAIPGKHRDDFKITVENGYLVIEMEKEDSTEETKDQYRRKEFSFEQFKRSVLLPENVKEDAIKANYKDGLLVITVQKQTVPDEKSVRRVHVS